MKTREHHPARRLTLTTLAFALALLAAPAARAADTYLVVDLSGGTNAASYPVSYLDAVPSGGWTDTYKTDKLVLRKIPAGTFTMGSPTNELGRESDETQHEVTLTKDFYIGVFEVTQRQWELVMGNRPSYFNNAAYYATRPVEWVSYYDIRENPNNTDDPIVNWPTNSLVNAASFMGRLRDKAGLSTIDLPTESQWEYACRAESTSALNSGSNLTGTTSCPNMSILGRYLYNGGLGSSQGCATNAGTAEVGSYAPNPWGLYDMHGNVFELCLDWRATYPGDVSDPVGNATGTRRQIRGGYWGCGAQECRSAYRHPTGDYPEFRGYFTGFRAAMILSISATDSDLDGLPDAWEIEHFGSITVSDGTGDFDRDGRTDAEERADITDPADAGSTLGLVLYYPMDGDGNDASGHGNNGTAVNTTSMRDRFGNSNRAFGFDGSGYLEAQQLPALNPQGDFAYSLWIYVQTPNYSPAGGAWYLDRRPQGYGDPLVSMHSQLNVSTSNLLWLIRYDNGSVPPGGDGNLSAGILSTNSWKHVLISRKYGERIDAYMDGVLISHVGDNPLSLTPDRPIIGNYVNASYGLVGAMDDFRIYNRALSSNEVARLYVAEPQPATHLITLHPGDHGSISNANSGSSYVTNVAHGAAFPAVQVIPNAGWTFTGWNPAAPETVTSNLTATAGYEAVATSTYRLIVGGGSWQQAQADAEARGGRLACFPTSNRWFDCVAQCSPGISDQSTWWIGATDERVEGVWEWVSGEAWFFEAWRPNEPNNANGIEHYANASYVPSVGSGVTWNDGDSTDTSSHFGYILELPGALPRPPTPDLSLSASDLRILSASGVQTANPAIGEPIILDVTLRNTGATNTTGDILVQVFHNGAPTNLPAYNSNAFSIVAAAVVAESLGVGNSRILQIPWTVTAPARVATLTVVAEFAANRAASQAGAALPNPETGYANNAVGRSIQIGSPPAGDYRIAVRPTVPSNMQSGVRSMLEGTAVYAWSTSAVIGALATISVNNESYTNRTALPNGAWSVLLNGLPAGDHVANIRVDDGGLVGSTNVLLSVSPGPATIDLRVKQIAFESGVYRPVGETAYAVTGTPVVLKVLIRNDGNTNSGSFTVAFRDPSHTSYASHTTNLPAFSEAWVTAPAGWVAQPGSHALTVVADASNTVVETSDSNNERGCVVIGVSARPDLIVADIAFEPAGPKHGDTVTITATVHNQGAAAVTAGEIFATAFSPGGTVTTNLATALAPGASIAMRTTWTATAGAHSVSATADSAAAMDEDSESNNSLTKTLFVRQALPDLRPYYRTWRDVSGLSFSPSQPVAGETVTVTCDIYNHGTVPLDAGRSFNAVFSADSIPFATNTITLDADLAVNGKVATATNWSGAAGAVSFAVAVDTAAVVTEESEGNNGTALGLTIYPAGALLVVADIAFSPYQPYPTSNVTLTAVIQNNGGLAGGAGALVTFHAGSTNVPAIGQANLVADIAPKGGTGSASIEWTAPGLATNVPIYAVIVGGERHEILTVTATPAPNLQVYSEDISVSPPLPVRGDRVTVLADIRNTEGSSATNFRVRFAYDARTGGWVDLGEVAVTALAAGANRTVASPVPIATDLGAYSVRVEILPNTAQGDANSNDNAATSSFLLAGTPDADAGEDVAGYVGQTIVFDGSGSTNATSYAWTLASAPAGSTGTLSGVNTVAPSLVPDQPGLYEVRLIVSDGATPSEPDTVRLTVSWLTLAVTSPHGTSTPATGLHHYAWAAVVDGQSTQAVVVGQTQYVCLGWTGAGSVPTNGAATNVTFTITNHSTLAWRWSTNYWLEVAVVGSGSVDVASGWFASGSNVVLTAAPDAGHCFTVWSGDTNACTIAGAEIAAPMTGPRSVRAAFVSAEVIAMVAALLRGSLEDQEAHGLYTPDALRNLFASPLLIAVDPVTGKIQLDLQMQWTDDLTPADWQPLGEPIRWSDTNTAGKAFYRLLLREPGEE